MQKTNAAEDSSENVQEDVKPDIAQIMADIRARIASDIEAHKDSRPAFHFKDATGNAGQRKAGELLNSEELRYLNQQYAFGPNLDLDSIQSHRPGFIGKSIVRIKRKLITVIWDLLKGYFTAEREFHANLVRYLNDVSKYVDARDASNFWELIKKIDVDVTKALERIERVSDEQMASMRSTERRVHETLDENLHSIRSAIADLNSNSVQTSDKLQTLESVARGLESIVARMATPPAITLADESDEKTSAKEYSYLLLENRYRGSEEIIAERLSIYPAYFEDYKQPVLEIGGGRGELLELFKQKNIAAYAVDIDAAMVEASSAKGLDARLGDGIAHLRSLENASLAGVIAIQVVEHLQQAQLEELFRLCVEKVQKGGTVIFETINPRSVLALSSNYFRDPTHVWPMHPDTLEYGMTLAGLVVEEVRFLSPVSDEAQLRPIPVQEHMTPRWVQTVECLNRNFTQLNQLLYGHQDFCIVARVS